VRLARDPDTTARMATAARARIRERFTVSRMARETTALYGELLSQQASQELSDVQA
jgi:hypothetical protein